ncbi:hypothetical protein PIB30_004508, partial [Stylosanthes scabra]|nr:hypothetical protein [Stylosanthes scabra]
MAPLCPCFVESSSSLLKEDRRRLVPRSSFCSSTPFDLLAVSLPFVTAVRRYDLSLCSLSFCSSICSLPPPTTSLSPLSVLPSAHSLVP